MESHLCQCDATELKKLTNPIFRLICHCNTCQEFYGTQYNDECTFRAKDCSTIDLGNVEFKSYQEGFSPIKRGKCKTCAKPKCFKVTLGSMAEFISFPTESLDASSMPPPFAHLYYGSRLQDAHDDVRKIDGHLRSQAAIQWAAVKSLFRR